MRNLSKPSRKRKLYKQKGNAVEHSINRISFFVFQTFLRRFQAPSVKLSDFVHSVPKSCVDTVFLEELVVVSALFDAVIGNYEDFVRVLDGGQSVRDHKGGSALR